MPTFELAPGLRLRPIAPADAADIYALVDAERARLRQWLGWVDQTPSVEAIDAFIRRSVEEAASGAGFTFVVLRGGAQRGVVSIVVDEPNRRGEIGYWLGQAEEGRGTMSRAVSALVRHGFESLDLHRITILAATGNVRSRAIPERLGFRLEGTLREDEWVAGHFVDHAVYGLLRSEWTGDR